MAAHVDSVATSSILRVTETDFMSRCRTGMPIFCEGQYKISLGIEKFTNSPWSHVATLLWIEALQEWGVLEATSDHGVHIGHLDHYLQTYDGPIVLADTPVLDCADMLALIQAQFDLVGEGYDSEQEASMVAHRLISALPIIEGHNKLFCSGLYQAGRAKTKIPLQFKGPGAASPEQVWTDPSIVPVCAFVK